MFSTVRRRMGATRLNKLLARTEAAVAYDAGGPVSFFRAHTKWKEPHCGDDGAIDNSSAVGIEHQESELLHRTEEGGELNPGGPAGGKGGAGSRSRGWETRTRHRAGKTCQRD